MFSFGSRPVPALTGVESEAASFVVKPYNSPKNCRKGMKKVLNSNVSAQ